MTHASALRRHPLVVPGLLAAILVVGAAIRVPNLGGPDFDVDEILHIYPAQRLMAGDPPLLPSGEPYDRALPFTTMVSWSGTLLGGVNEWTARLPSVIFGCLTILMVFQIGRRWYSDAAGLVAAGVTAVVPMQVAFSREVRMYALLQLLYLATIYLLFEAFETNVRRPPRGIPQRVASLSRDMEMRPWLLLAAAPLALLAWWTHPVTAPALVGPAAYVLCMGVIGPLANLSRPVVWKYRAAAAVVVVAGSATFVLDLGSVRELYEFARTNVPDWARGNVSNWRFYAYRLAELYPVMFGTFVVSAMFALTRNWKATLYLLLCFGVPFVLHSFVFGWKSDRYLFHLMPLLFIVFGVSAPAAAAALHARLSTWAGGVVRWRPHAVAWALTIASAASLLGAAPELREGLKLHQQDVLQFVAVRHFNWKKATELVSERAGPSDVIVSSRALLSKYYGARLPLFFLNNDDLSLMLEQNLRRGDGTLIEYTAGAELIVDLAGLRRVVAEHPAGWFVTERIRLTSASSFPRDVVRFVEDHFQPEVVPGAPDMAVWRWPAPEGGGTTAK